MPWFLKLYIMSTKFFEGVLIALKVLLAIMITELAAIVYVLIFRI
jgi:hypothetical protein